MLVHLKTCPRYQLLSRKLRMVVYLFRVNLSPVLNWPLAFMVIEVAFVIEVVFATEVSPILFLATTVKVSSG